MNRQRLLAAIGGCMMLAACADAAGPPSEGTPGSIPVIASVYASDGRSVALRVTPSGFYPDGYDVRFLANPGATYEVIVADLEKRPLLIVTLPAETLAPLWSADETGEWWAVITTSFTGPREWKLLGVDPQGTDFSASRLGDDGDPLSVGRIFDAADIFVRFGARDLEGKSKARASGRPKRPGHVVSW